jgi:acylaminoacyl-peptidase
LPFLSYTKDCLIHKGYAVVIGQYPNTFTAASMRNPVIDGTQIATSDISDWYYSEFGIPYYPSLHSLPSGTTFLSVRTKSLRDVPGFGATSASAIPSYSFTLNGFEALQRASPISHVEKVKAHVLILLGGSDQRVSNTQGLAYYHALKARSAIRKGDTEVPEVDMLVFKDDGHPIDGIESGSVSLEAMVDWFGKHAAKTV